jgi:DNA polymerase
MRPDLFDERAPGATFDIYNIGWIDFETKGSLPIATVGTDRYARNARSLMIGWSIGTDPVIVTTAQHFELPLRWADLPHELRKFFDRVARGDAIFCAHNAGFDRAIWNYATEDFPVLEPWMIIDTRVQAAASGLPAALDAACRYSGAEILKDTRGKDLIRLFCLPDSTATPDSHPDEWQDFLRYAGVDIGAMRELFRRTRQLPIAEWREYWAAEAINDYGVTIDLPLVEAAAKMAEADKRISARDLDDLTDGAVETVDQVQRIIIWLKARLPDDGVHILISEHEEIDLDTGEILKPQKTSLTRDRVVRLLAYLDALEAPTELTRAAQRVLQIRLYGGSKTPAKFGKMLTQHVGGVIRGQYVFNGASQTGRFSAKGVQVHNLMRTAFDHEIDAIDALVGGASPSEFAGLGDDTPISRKLSLLIRPSLIAPPGHAFCWGDWSNIEARITPWLAKDPEADARLAIFRAVDNKTEKFDVYTRTAARLSHLELGEVTETIRQRGKVVELACTFGGARNALLSMAASYGMHLTDQEADAAVAVWREENPWAQRFWGRHDDRGSYGLWGAANCAMETPGQAFSVGRIVYVYLKDYLGGSLLCRLPSGRYLTYRRIKWERVEEVDEETGVITSVRYELMFSRDMGRIKLWPGLLCENATQAAAADLMRGTLRRLVETDWEGVVSLHTHDEIVCEAPEDLAGYVAAELNDTMEAGFEWTEGLPIAADTKIGRWYSKSRGSIGL